MCFCLSGSYFGRYSDNPMGRAATASGCNVRGVLSNGFRTMSALVLTCLYLSAVGINDETVSVACLNGSSNKCAYRAVVCGCEWPNKAPITGSELP